jgi:ABC-2 type transport system permease protein
MILYLASPDTAGMPMSAFTALVASSLAGALAAVMVAVGMMNEKSRKVYDLFLVRPVKAAHIILAKFGATFLFVTLAVLVSIGVGMLADISMGNAPTGVALTAVARSMVMSVSMIAVASAVGVLIGASISSILVGVILVLYGGNQLVGLVAMLTLQMSDNIIVQLVPSIGLTLLLLIIAVQLFKRLRG